MIQRFRFFTELTYTHNTTLVGASRSDLRSKSSKSVKSSELGSRTHWPRPCVSQAKAFDEGSIDYPVNDPPAYIQSLSYRNYWKGKSSSDIEIVGTNGKA